MIFNEPHAYISPKHYGSEQNVPVWNYISVHVYGQGKLISDTNYETAFKQQWNNLSEDYKQNLLKGIVAFDVIVTDIQAKKN